MLLLAAWVTAVCLLVCQARHQHQLCSAAASHHQCCCPWRIPNRSSAVFLHFDPGGEPAYKLVKDPEPVSPVPGPPEGLQWSELWTERSGPEEADSSSKAAGGSGKAAVGSGKAGGGAKKVEEGAQQAEVDVNAPSAPMHLWRPLKF